MQQDAPSQIHTVGGMTPEAWLHLLNGDEVHGRPYDPRANGPVGVFQLRGHDMVRRVVVVDEPKGDSGRRAKTIERELRQDVVTFHDLHTASCSCRLFRENGLCRHTREAEERLSVLRERPLPITYRPRGQVVIEAFVDEFVNDAETRSLDQRRRTVPYAGGYQPKGIWADLELDSHCERARKLCDLVRKTYPESWVRDSLTQVEMLPRILLLLLSGVNEAEIAKTMPKSLENFTVLVKCKANSLAPYAPVRAQAMLDAITAPLGAVQRTLDESITWFLAFDGPPDEGEFDNSASAASD